MDFSLLIDYLNNNSVKYETNIKTSSIVSIQVGGIAPLIIYPNSIDAFVQLMTYINRKYKYFILGNGTNSYFQNYYDGVIISTKLLNEINVHKSEIIAESGALLNNCAEFASKNSLTGLEFIYGIPGSIGGGLYMNSSAFGSMISYVVSKCLVYDTKSCYICELNNNEMDFYEKHSIFMSKRYIVLKAYFNLRPGNHKSISDLMDTYIKKREQSQPLNQPSAGSAFKRPIGNYASKLIDEAGLKGYTIGGAQISTKHAGFIVNLGNATADDVKSLIDFIQKEIKKRFDVNLEEEIILVE